MLTGRAPLSVADLSTLRDIRNDLQRDGKLLGMPFVQRGLDVLDKLLEPGDVSEGEGQLCLQPHYAVIVEAQKDAEIYQRGDVECPSCLRRMADKHQEIADMFRARLTAFGDAP